MVVSRVTILKMPSEERLGNILSYQLPLVTAWWGLSRHCLGLPKAWPHILFFYNKFSHELSPCLLFLLFGSLLVYVCIMHVFYTPKITEAYICFYYHLWNISEVRLPYPLMSQWRESRHMDIIQWELENVIFQLGTLLSLINESHLIKEQEEIRY